MKRTPTVLFHVQKRHQRALVTLATTLLENGKTPDEAIAVIVKVVDDVVDLAAVGSLIGGAIGGAAGVAVGGSVGAALDRVDDKIAIAIATGCVRRAEKRRKQAA